MEPTRPTPPFEAAPVAVAVDGGAFVVVVVATTGSKMTSSTPIEATMVWVAKERWLKDRRVV